jgi:hypothetical protein
MIQNSAMLIELNISAWTGRKMDKKVSAEIDVSKNTKARGGNYHKHLLAGTQALETVQELVGTVRRWHHEQTLPWSDSGSRLLPMKNFFEYKRQLSEYEREFNDSVDSMIQAYPQLVSAAAFQLGALFNRNEYPDVHELQGKFALRYAFMPVPDGGDFRIDAEEETKNELKAQYEKFYEERLNSAMKDMWDRLHVCLTRMSEKLADSVVPRNTKGKQEIKTQIFRDSLVSNAVDLCALLTNLNVTDDPKLEHARKELEKTIAGVTPDQLRENYETRTRVKSKVDEILKAFDF